MKKYYKFIFMALFGLFIFMPKDTFAYDRIELSSQNGTVLWSANNTEVQPANVSDVKYIIFYFDLPLTSDTLYTLNNDFAYSVAGNTGNGVELIYLLLNGAENAFEHTWTTILQQDYDNFYHHIYVNHIKFYSYLSGTVQVQLTYVLSNTAFIGDVGIRDKSLVYDGSASEDTNDAINSGVTNIINNNNQNTDKIIDNENKNQEQTNERLDKIEGFLIDDTEPSSDISALGNVQGLLPPGPVDSLLNIPFKFLSIIVSSLGDLCVPMSIDWVFNKSLTFPCFGDIFYDKVPDGLMIFINLIPSGFILITYFKYLYKKVNRAVTMETNADDEWGVI